MAQSQRGAAEITPGILRISIFGFRGGLRDKLFGPLSRASALPTALVFGHATAARHGRSSLDPLGFPLRSGPRGRGRSVARSSAPGPTLSFSSYKKVRISG